MAKAAASSSPPLPTLNLIARAIAVGRAYAKEQVPASPAAGEENFWQKQGPKIREAITATYNALKAGVEEEVGTLGITWKQVNRTQVTNLITEAVKHWDNDFGWDAPNMDEKAEDTFYAFLAKQQVSNLFSADGM